MSRHMLDVHMAKAGLDGLVEFHGLAAGRHTLKAWDGRQVVFEPASVVLPRTGQEPLDVTWTVIAS